MSVKEKIKIVLSDNQETKRRIKMKIKQKNKQKNMKEINDEIYRDAWLLFNNMIVNMLAEQYDMEDNDSKTKPKNKKQGEKQNDHNERTKSNKNI